MKYLTDDLIYSLDPVKFAELVGFPDLDEWQREALRYKGDRMLLCCSRQAGKSTVTAIRALHQVLFAPGSLVLLVSPSQRQSSELFKKVTGLIKALPVEPEKIEDNRLSVHLSNQSRIVSLPSSEQTVRGYSGAALIILDEASRIPDSLFYSLTPMVATSGGTMILLSTPAGKRGFFHEAYISDEWHKFTITAEDVPRIPADFLERERKQIGDFYYKQEYDCKFMEPEGSLFTLDQIEGCVSDEVEAWNFTFKGVSINETD